MKKHGLWPIIGLFAAIAVLGGLVWLADRGDLPASTEEQAGEPASIEFEVDESPDADTPEGVVEDFMTYWLETRPMESVEGAEEKAVALFSEGGKQNLEMVDGEYSLRGVMAVQDWPDEGWEIVGTTYKENPATGEPKGLAEVAVQLNYSGSGAVPQVFVLSENTEGKWLVDDIFSPSA